MSNRPPGCDSSCGHGPAGPSKSSEPTYDPATNFRPVFGSTARPWLRLAASSTAPLSGVRHRVSQVPPQVPVAGSQVWVGHWQVTGLLPAHWPAWQVSVCVQALLSLQDVPSATGVVTHPWVGWQDSAVQLLLSVLPH